MASIQNQELPTRTRLSAMGLNPLLGKIITPWTGMSKAFKRAFRRTVERRRLARLRRILLKLSDHLLADIGLEECDLLNDRDHLREIQQDFLNGYQTLGR